MNIFPFYKVQMLFSGFTVDIKPK